MAQPEPVFAPSDPLRHQVNVPISPPSSTAGTDPSELHVAPPNYDGADLSVMAFERDLPELLATAPGRWVAYAHGKRLRIATSQPELYKYCLKELGLGHEQFVVRWIMPANGPDVESAPR